MGGPFCCRVVRRLLRLEADGVHGGDFVFRAATVQVDVLPPVDTSAWHVDTIDEHVREVRNMFARVLGQPEDVPRKAKAKDKGDHHLSRAFGKLHEIFEAIEFDDEVRVQIPVF